MGKARRAAGPYPVAASSAATASLAAAARRSRALSGRERPPYSSPWMGKSFG